MDRNTMQEPAADFVHPPVNEPVRAIGGEYVFTRENRAVVNGLDVLYYTGCFVVDSSCCGVGGCAYALVAGFVEDWKYKASDSGRPVSRVRPVAEPEAQKRITDMIRHSDPLIQVSFIPASCQKSVW